MGFASCKDAHIVRVVDETGVPVAGATVTVSAPSFNGKPVVTDAEGRAGVDTSILGAKFVGAWKDGYEPGTIALPDRWPVEIKLRKKA